MCTWSPVHPTSAPIYPPSHQSKGPIWTPATIFLVTDHLYHLLVKNYMRRDKAAGALSAAARVAEGSRMRGSLYRLRQADAAASQLMAWVQCPVVHMPLAGCGC